MASRARAAVVLAAGKGSRMQSDVIKVLHPLCGRTILARVLDALRGAGVQRIVVVVGHQADRVRAQVGDGVEFAVQAESLGTAHALLQAVPLLAGYEGSLLVACGDTPLITAETFAALLRAHERAGRGATLLSADLDDPDGYGRVLRSADGEDVLGIVEHADADARQRAITEINTGTYCFDATPLMAALEEIRPANAQGEYYLPDALAVIREGGRAVGALRLDDPGEALGINDRAQLAQASQVLKARTLDRLFAAGISVVDPQNTYVEPEVEIGPDSVLHPFSSLRGACRIGSRNVIGPHVDLHDVRTGDGVWVKGIVAEQCEFADGARIGPSRDLAPDARLSLIGSDADEP